MSESSTLPRRTALATAIAVALSSPAVQAQEKRVIEEVVVTATKREESLQDVPIAVSALTGEQLDEIGITNMADYVIELPGVTAGGSGPGQNTIYIRGVASTTPNLTTAGVAGLSPNVAFYLDQQPLSQPGRNLDVYAADLQRVEVLAGPQGTLFGASSQAGNVRLITNKPDFSDTYGSVKVGVATMAEGDASNNIEAMLNVPITENFAVRGVFYNDVKGGFIDNVAGTVDASESARFRAAGTVRENGVVVANDGFQAGADLSAATFESANAVVESDANETLYVGGRLSAKWDINDQWSLLVSYHTQDIESDGVFFADPDLGDLEIQRYSPDSIDDTFNNYAWTLDGMIGELEVVYTGAFTDRDTEQVVDYTDYLFVGQYLPYYICDGSVTYPSADPVGNCGSPNLFVASTTKTEVMTHEFRVLTDPTRRWRVTAGAFYSDLELAELNDFTYPASVDALSFDGVTRGFAPNYPLTNVSVTGVVGNAQAGYFSDPGPFPAGVIFRNDVLRTDEQFGIFGEFTYDVTDSVSVVLGARYYDVEVDLEGSANGSFFNFGATTDAQAFGTNISAQFAPDNTVGAPDKAATDGTIFKATVDWRVADNNMVYFTISEGFRTGLLNRPGGQTGPNNYIVPFALDTDDVTNFEVGTKSTFLDGSLRFNASAFFVDIERLQTTIFDTNITNLFFSANAADAEVMGIEGDFIYLPNIDGLTISGAFSLLDTEITEVITPTAIVQQGDELAYAPSFQGNLRARYEWEVGSMLTAHVMPSVSTSSSAFSDVITINRDKVDSYTMMNISAGVSGDTWSAELFVNNVTDERAEVARNFVFDRQRVTYADPRTIGVRASFGF